jgi:hypothetical protein
MSAKLLPTHADRGCHVVSVTDPYGRILGCLDRTCCVNPIDNTHYAPITTTPSTRTKYFTGTLPEHSHKFLPLGVASCCASIQLVLYDAARHLHLQHRQHTSHEEETSNNRRKTKSLHCPQLDHHDADGLAGHKTWRTAQTTTRIF